VVVRQDRGYSEQMGPKGRVVIISYILAAMTMAVIPWVLGLPVLRWHPGMQTKTARRTYRWATYCLALFFTLFVMVPALALL